MSDQYIIIQSGPTSALAVYTGPTAGGDRQQTSQERTLVWQAARIAALESELARHRPLVEAAREYAKASAVLHADAVVGDPSTSDDTAIDRCEVARAELCKEARLLNAAGRGEESDAV